MSSALDVLDDVRARLPTRDLPRWLEQMKTILTDHVVRERPRAIRAG